MSSDESKTSLQDQLARPFEATEVKWKAQVVRGNRALSVAYVDARVVMDRLDAVFGVGGWQDAYAELPATKSVVCKLRVKIGQDWVEKSDVGSQSDQPDEGDRMKSAFSDALKRAAVHFGVGRYLYRLPQQWVDYDPQTRQLTATPKLPSWAVPGKADDKDRPSAPTLTREQWLAVKAWLTNLHVSQRAFLDHLGVQRPGLIPAARFDEVLRLAQQPRKEWLLAGAPPPADRPKLDAQGDPRLREPLPDEPLGEKGAAPLERRLLERGEDYADAVLRVLGLRDLTQMPHGWKPGVDELLRRHRTAAELLSWQRDALGGDSINDLPEHERDRAFRRSYQAPAGAAQ